MVTVSRKLLLATPPAPSLTERVTSALPSALVRGRMVAVRLLPVPPNAKKAAFTRFVFDEAPERMSPAGALSMSSTVTGKINATFLPVVRSVNAERVGASFTFVTVTVKLRKTLEFCDAPSLTVTVMSAVPLLLAAGVKRRVPAESGLL